jgi:hypothetical protein
MFLWTSVFLRTTQCCESGDRTPHGHRCENLNSNILRVLIICSLLCIFLEVLAWRSVQQTSKETDINVLILFYYTYHYMFRSIRSFSGGYMSVEPSLLTYHKIFTRYIPKFKQNLPPACSLVCWTYFFDPEDGGDKFLRNIGWNSTDYMASYPRRSYSSKPPLWKPQILQNYLHFATFY